MHGRNVRDQETIVALGAAGADWRRWRAVGMCLPGSVERGP